MCNLWLRSVLLAVTGSDPKTLRALPERVGEKVQQPERAFRRFVSCRGEERAKQQRGDVVWSDVAE